MTVYALQETKWYIKDGSPASTFLLLFKAGEIRSSHSSNCLTKLPAILQAKNTVREIETQAKTKNRKKSMMKLYLQSTGENLKFDHLPNRQASLLISNLD